MAGFVASKVVATLVTILLAITLAFLLGRLAGDPIANLLGELAPEEQVEAMRRELGYDRPLPVQLLAYLGDVARGDLGESLRYGRSNWELIRGRLPASLQLAGAAIVLAILVGVPLGVAAALREGSLTDRLLMGASLLGQSLPLFWLGMVFVLVFSVGYGWFPAGGYGTWRHLLLPAVTLATFPLARVARITRSTTTEVLEQEYVLAARARGLSTWRVVWRHVLRNAALPVLTVIGLQAGGLLSGAVTIEVVFAWPGLGTLAVSAVQFRDFVLVQAVVVVGAVVFVLVNLTVDLLYGLVDPRIRERVG